ncbi:MAG: hypothetical protein IK999_09640 [Ruminococcus sp.]|nr:hypothetical protein [Ruminococcus sp.]
MIIKKFIECGKQTKQKLKELEQTQKKDSPEYRFLSRKMAVLIDIHEYIYHGNWTRESSREKYIALIRSKWDYNLIAARYDTSRASLDVFVSRQEKRLKRTIGSALVLIEIGYIEEGLARFYADSGTLSKQEFTYSMRDLLPAAENKDSFTVSDCPDEVDILRSIRRSNVQEWLSDTDFDKLAYLMFLLETDDPAYQQQKRELVAEIVKKDR